MLTFHSSSAPVRASIGQILEDFKEKRIEKTQLGALMKKKGGLYKAPAGGTDTVMFNIYTGVTFRGLKCDVRRGMSIDA